MSSIEFGKKCRPYYIKYKEIFGYVPRRMDYACSQTEYFDALKNAIETRTELSNIIPKRVFDYSNQNIRY